MSLPTKQPIEDLQSRWDRLIPLEARTDIDIGGAPVSSGFILQILDAGRITLANDETKNLNNYSIIFTSNIGAGEAMRMENSAFATMERTVLRRVDQSSTPRTGRPH